MLTTYSRNCKRCNEPQYLLAKPQDIQAWMEGVSIQDALHYLTPDERELIISGICSTCWEELFGGDEQ